MKLRAPAYPLINIDPYFNVWSATDVLTDSDTMHWTNSPQIISGVAEIDGEKLRVIGKFGSETIPAMKQVSVDVTAFSTTYVFEQNGVRLTLKFTSAVLPDDLYLLSRPVSYLEVTREIIDGKRHTVRFSLSVSEQICMNNAGDDEVVTESLILGFGKYQSVKMGTKTQKTLTRSGDDLRIEWGYFYLTGQGETAVTRDEASGMTFVGITSEIRSSALFSFAYDDVESIVYFGKNLKSYWNRDGQDIRDEIEAAHNDYKATLKKANEMADRMFIDAVRAGGEKYAELLELATRQTIGAHKLALDENGEVLFISKECFSNGCAATVDVSYPSIPFYLIYNPELVKGMMRPIIKYTRSPEWIFDFAPHDAGQYPLVNGQVYGNNALEKQMPVEECGNMIIMDAAVAIATKDPSFANEHMDLLETWVKYLIDNGRDPANQLCTDDFAGHLAHNCNLTLKAIMGIVGFGILKGMNGNKREQKKYISMARDMAKDWAVRASNGDGSYRLAFDKPGTFSMKYNIVWDKLWGTEVMARDVIASEVASYRRVSHPYGLPLDNRMPYTKSDWLIWTATLAEDRQDFEDLVAPMWEAFNTMDSRVPMTDWYMTKTGIHRAYYSKRCQKDISFRNRTVVGGYFIKLLEYRGIMKL